MKKLLLLLLVGFPGFLLLDAQDRLTAVLNEELQRNMTGMAGEEIKPYFLSYRVNEIRSFRIRSSFGQLMESSPGHVRRLAVQLRVGSHELDNTHPLRGSTYGMLIADTGVDIPVDDNPDGIRQILWRETDKHFNNASERFARVRAEHAIKVETEDRSDDFSREEPVKWYEPPIEDADSYLDAGYWEGRLKDYSGIFLKYGYIMKGTATLSFSYERKYYVSSEGSDITENRLACRLMISAESQADDGMVLPLHVSYFGFRPGDLPDHSSVLADVENMAETLRLLREAPIADAYSGPALLAPQSAGVFFHEIFGHRVEGHRLKQEGDAQTFKKKVGDKVLHEDLSVIFDPEIEKYGDHFLYGSYKFDCEGQRGRRVTIVEDGILKDFLMGRIPIEGFSNSNGHGRAQAGYQPVSRQSNLIIETSNPHSEERLREMLIEEARRQGREFGYYFVSTMGGFTMTGRFLPNAFNVTPLVVYRVYTDGREDQLVRGVDLVGTPLAIFSNIIAAGDSQGMFTGICGAESGGVPTSTICPMVFVSQIETQRKPKGQERLPVLPRP
jgi:TldD protein